MPKKRKLPRSKSSLAGGRIGIHYKCDRAKLKLKPCPFCGGRATRYLDKPGGKIEGVVCESCYAYGPRAPHDTAASLVCAWNRRAKSVKEIVHQHDAERALLRAKGRRP